MEDPSIFATSFSYLQSWGLDLSNTVDQGYCGADVMSSGKAGTRFKYINSAQTQLTNFAQFCDIDRGRRSVPVARNLSGNDNIIYKIT